MRTKTCSACKAILKLEYFDKDGSRKDGYSYICKGCVSDKYLAQKSSKAGQDKALRAMARASELRQRIVSTKLGKSCHDCGKEYPTAVMEYDHRDSEAKTCNVSRCTSWEKALIEIAKCDLVCANCHRIRTIARRQRI